ncbi:hypothetical protein M9Y10_008072 [Tritrichomonas musculus]|uniref:Uncharacterized protein n=1 Tax=Tritrichomonas musculus TaxID=1915356 RepID=A0ABR2IY62_9EUKA
MSFNDTNPLSRSSVSSNTAADGRTQPDSTMLDLLRSYQEDLQQRLNIFEKDENYEAIPSSLSQNYQRNQSQSSKNEAKLINNQSHQSDNSGSSQGGASSDLEKELINDAELHSHLPIEELQNGFLSNLNNFIKSGQNSNEAMEQISKQYTKPVKQISDEALDEDTDMSDIISTSVSDLNNENKNTFSVISGISSKQIEDSKGSLSFLNYAINDQQSSNLLPIPEENDASNNPSQLSHISGSQFENNFTNKISNLDAIPEDDEEDGIPLGMSHDSQLSMKLSASNKTNSIVDSEDKNANHKNSRMSLADSHKHGKNNSGEFVGKKPSMMTIVEDDDEVEEVVEYEEEYEEEADSGDDDDKDSKEKDSPLLGSSHNSTNKYDKIAKETKNDFNKNTTSKTKRILQPSESQQNLHVSHLQQIPTSNSTNNIPLQNYLKSYSGLNSKIINLNPIDEEDEYESSDNANEPISLMEASDINIFSHQHSLSGSRTIEDLIAEQKKAAIALSSSTIISSSSPKDRNDNLNEHGKSHKMRSNISLSELVPKERSFTVEDMMRLQNVRFPTNKEKGATSNSSSTAAGKPKYSKEDMIKDQKISIKSKDNEKSDSNIQNKESELDGNDILSNFIESQSQLSKSKVDGLTNLDEFVNSDTSIRATNADNIESIISNIDEKNSGDKVVSSGFDSSRFNEILNEEESEEEDEANFEEITYEVITENNGNNENNTTPSSSDHNSSKNDNAKSIHSFSENNSQKSEDDQTKSEKAESSIGNSILSDFTNEDSHSGKSQSDKSSSRSRSSKKSSSSSENKNKSTESDDFINSITPDFIEAAAAEVEAEREKKKKQESSKDLEFDFIDDSKEGSKIKIVDPLSRTSDIAITVDFIEESDGKKSSSKGNVESDINITSDFADESKSEAKSESSSNAQEKDSISVSFIDEDSSKLLKEKSKKKNKNTKKRRNGSQSSEKTSDLNDDSISSEFISEDSENKKSSSSSRSKSSKSNEAETFDNSSQFIDVESVKSKSKVESSSNFISEKSSSKSSSSSSKSNSKSGKVENESDFIDTISSLSKTKGSSNSSSSHSSSSSSKSKTTSQSGSINVESIHSLKSSSASSKSKSLSESSSNSGSDSINVESIHSLKSNSSSSKSRTYSRSSKAGESDSINVESIRSLKSSSSSKSKTYSSSNKASESDSINVESIHSLRNSSSSYSKSKTYSESSKESGSDSINVESIHSLKSSSTSPKSKTYSGSSKTSESDSINVESIHSLKSSSSKSKTYSESSKASESINVESVRTTSSSSSTISKSRSKIQSSSIKGSDFIEAESFHSSSSSSKRSRSRSRSFSDTKKESGIIVEEDDDFITTDSSQSKAKADRSSPSSDKKKNDSDSDANVESFFEFSDPDDQNQHKSSDDGDKPLPKLQIIHSTKPGKPNKSKVLNIKSKSKNNNNKSSEQDTDEPLKLSESKSRSKFSTVSILDEIGSETSMSNLSISANTSEKTSGEFIGTINEGKSIYSNIGSENSKSDSVIQSDDSLKKIKVPKIPKFSKKSSLKQPNVERKESPRRQNKIKSDGEDNNSFEDDFIDNAHSKSDDNETRYLQFKKLQISKAYEYPSKFNEKLDSDLNSRIKDEEEENDNEEVEVDNMTESIIKKPHKKLSKRVTIVDLTNDKEEEDEIAKNNAKNPSSSSFIKRVPKRERLSMSPIIVQKDIMPSRANISLTNITNVSNTDSKSRHKHVHKHRHEHRHHSDMKGKTELDLSVQKVPNDDRKRGIKTPQPQHHIIRFSRSPTTVNNTTTTTTDTSIRMSNIPTAAEMIDQNYVNTLKSAKLHLQYIKESINASRQMRFTRQSAMDPFPYTLNS